MHNKLSSMDGHLRVNSIDKDVVTYNSFNSIINILAKDSNIINYSYYLEKHAMIRSIANESDGIIYYGFESGKLFQVLNIDQYLMANNTSLPNINEIIIGYGLAKKLNVNIGDELTIFNLDHLLESNLLNAKKVKVNNIFRSGLSEYDANIVFGHIETLSTLFNLDSTISGILVRSNSYLDISTLDNSIYSKLITNGFISTSWMERHFSILEWLKVFNKPIKLLMLFIAIIGISNISFSIWVLLSTRKSELSLLRSFGYSKTYIKAICITQILSITIISLAFGNLLTILLIKIQDYYKIVKLDSQIYFTDYLPVVIQYDYLLMTSTSLLMLTILISLIPAYKVSTLNISKFLTSE